MDSFSVKPTIGFIFLGMFLSMGICNVGLLVHTLKLDAIIEKIDVQQASLLPARGETIPSINGFSMIGGHPLKVVPAAIPRLALLFFREGCHYCRANWKNWDSVFASGGANVKVVFITTDKTLTQSYEKSHPLLQQKQVVLGVSQALLNSLKLRATPETIYVVNGKVKQDWIGVLTDINIKEIMTATSHS